mmetsp:Transcript_128404/g.273831  ORF Transcript_128404/g.273831 Transcript_128404/m.273831 type:complete len:260 (-) Transcript_128404:585-1364(-)
MHLLDLLRTRIHKAIAILPVALPFQEVVRDEHEIRLDEFLHAASLHVVDVGDLHNLQVALTQKLHRLLSPLLEEVRRDEYQSGAARDEACTHLRARTWYLPRRGHQCQDAAGLPEAHVVRKDSTAYRAVDALEAEHCFQVRIGQAAPQLLRGEVAGQALRRSLPSREHMLQHALHEVHPTQGLLLLRSELMEEALRCGCDDIFLCGAQIEGRPASLLHSFKRHAGYFRSSPLHALEAIGSLELIATPIGCILGTEEEVA